MIANSVGKAVENVALATQPVVYGVAASTVLGLHLNEWIMLGTGVLLILNLGLAVTRIVGVWLEWVKGEDK